MVWTRFGRPTRSGKNNEARRFARLNCIGFQISNNVFRKWNSVVWKLEGGLVSVSHKLVHCPDNSSTSFEIRDPFFLQTEGQRQLFPGRISNLLPTKSDTQGTGHQEAMRHLSVSRRRKPSVVSFPLSDVIMHDVWVFALRALVYDIIIIALRLSCCRLLFPGVRSPEIHRGVSENGRGVPLTAGNVGPAVLPRRRRLGLSPFPSSLLT